MINKRLTYLLLVIALSATVISANSIQPSAKSEESQVSPSKPENDQAPREAASIVESKSESKLEEPKLGAPIVTETQAKEDKEAEGRRKGRAESTATTTAEPPKAEEKATSEKPTAEVTTKTKPPEPAKVSSAKSASKQSLSGKSGSTKSKLPANLGTVTSTGSGGASHYMSKHDAYSAIAEKHGALAQDAMRKSDKRHSHSGGFGGIQKASGFTDMLSSFKGVTDGGLARKNYQPIQLALGASMRSIMKSKYSVPAYVASALLGAVALMAFYESPISPLPVPALPEPPVGRFPPEMPNISPNVQVPFRTNQQQQQQYGQNYNQRSLMMGPAASNQQPQQQVYFPGPQQREATNSPVQSLAANILSVAKQQTAQRKSGLDYDPSTSRSLFGSSANLATQKMSPPANQQQRPGSNSFLSFFGLGGGSSSEQVSSPQLAQIEPKGSQNLNVALSNSHVVNKMKSYFRGPSPLGSSSAAGVSNSNPYDQYSRMSLIQALMKDTAFLPGFLTSGNRKSSSVVSAGSAATAAKPDNLAAPPQQVAASRMQVGNDGQLPILAGVAQESVKQSNKANSGFGMAGKIANALLETFSPSIAQRSASAAQQGERKSASDELSLAAAKSLLRDFVTYNNEQRQHQQHQQQQQQPQQPQLQAQSSQSQQAQQAPQSQSGASSPQQQQSPPNEIPQASARSDDDSPAIITADDQLFSAKKIEDQKKVAQEPTGSGGNAQQHIRKTRSVGYEYPLVSNNDLVLREQQPSRAAQINNVIDFVADSYANNRYLFNFVMNQVGLSQAVPYVDQILASGVSNKDHQ